MTVCPWNVPYSVCWVADQAGEVSAKSSAALRAYAPRWKVLENGTANSVAAGSAADACAHEEFALFLPSEGGTDANW